MTRTLTRLVYQRSTVNTMNNKLLTLLTVILLCPNFLVAQNRKSIEAVRINPGQIEIDGELNEVAWQNAPNAGDFVQNRPNAGEASTKETEVKILYDDEAIYIAANLKDSPNDIYNFLSNRDELGNSDFFAVIIDPYNAGQNGVGLLVTPSGVQFDTYYSSNGEDENWNAVWYSKTRIHENGWAVEYKIPYAVLRFASKNIQDWGINFGRESRINNERSWWNNVDPNTAGFLNQAGVLRGLKNIAAPKRLFLYPYASTVLIHDGENNASETQVNGGMDLKYGINDAFTLDATLIPDFSGVRSDNQVLNLSPFEVRFNENRQFFTEGTELFNKGGLFYSRRIGQSFGNIVGELSDNDSIISRPNDAPLINATKISGRTNKGLGIGLFNALTNSSYLEVQDLESGETREVEADPLTNFNVLVLDQNLKNNSSFTFINTNVLRAKGASDANVTGINFSLNDKKIKWNVSGGGTVSQIFSKDSTGRTHTDVGFKYFLDFGKVSGKFQYGISQNVESDNYNPNDLGFLRSPNEISHFSYFSYNRVNPTWILNRFRARVNLFHEAIYKPRRYSNWGYHVNVNGQFKNFWNFGFNHGYRPSKVNDFFESRTDGYILERPANYNFNLWIGSDSRKKLRVNAWAGFWGNKAWDQLDNWLGGFISYQVSDRFAFNHNLEINNQRKSRGFVEKIFDGDVLQEIIIGTRDIKDVVNTLSSNYIFTNRMGLTFRMRHYWRKVVYENYEQLDTNGQLVPTSYTGLDEANEKLNDVNFNVFNIDLVYNWQFAPGSEIRFVWKRAIFSSNDQTDIRFFRNFSNTIESPAVDSFTIRFLYFLDYQNMKRWFKK